MNTIELAVILFILPDNRVVLQRRTMDAPKNAGLLGMYGGHVDPGETNEQAARRELEEETSLKANDLIFKKSIVHEIVQDGDIRRYTTYVINIESNDFDTYEGEGNEVHSVNELMVRTDLAPYLKAIVTKILL